MAEAERAADGSRTRAAANGCGGEDSEWVPDSYRGVFNFHEACNRHDDCYATPGVVKEGCDNLFLEAMKTACQKYSPRRRVRKRPGARKPGLTCLGVARFYREVVRHSGKARKAFADAQREAAEPASGAPGPEQASGAPFEPNESIRTAHGPLRLESPYEGAIERYKDEDWFFINRSRGQGFSVSFANLGCIPEPVPDNVDSDGCPIFDHITVVVYDPRGEVVQQAFGEGGEPQYLAKMTLSSNQREAIRTGSGSATR